jgi:hypothetical protein
MTTSICSRCSLSCSAIEVTSASWREGKCCCRAADIILMDLEMPVVDGDLDARLRGGVPGVQLRVPTEAQSAPSAGCTRVRDRQARINWVLDCDVQSFFDKVGQSWLIRGSSSLADPQLRIGALGVSASRSRSTFRLSGVHALLRDPSERLGFRAREEASGQANACQASRDQGAAHGHTSRGDRKAGPLALPGSARLDGLLCYADERLSDLSIPASHDRTLARRSDASKPKTSIT